MFHTVLCPIPDPERVVAEALRVTADGGRLAIFDGDYATTTVAICENDPRQACAEAAIEALVHDVADVIAANVGSPAAPTRPSLFLRPSVQPGLGLRRPAPP